MHNGRAMTRLVFLACVFAVACSDTVEHPDNADAAGTGSGTGASGATSGTGAAGPGSSTGTGATGGGCSGSPFDCVEACATDYFQQSECIDGTWTCPPGWFPASNCENPCFGLPLSCESCGERGWQCDPTPRCAEGCPGLVCLECPDIPGPVPFGACTCSCDAAGQYSCDLTPGCCNQDMDCGDVVYVPCVEHVCKQTVPGACWVDAECPPGQQCIGASVCPCGYDCDGFDEPGQCM